MKKSLLFIGAATLLVSSCALAFSTSGLTSTLIVGNGITRANQTQTLRLTNTPDPGQENQYVGSRIQHGTPLIGVAIEKKLNTDHHGILSSIGIEIDYARNNAVKGTVKPLINVAPDFDELNYLYDIHTLVVQAKAHLYRPDLFHHVGGYLEAGLGAGIIRLSDYREYSPTASSAAPMLSPYGNHDTVNPALSAGLGATYPLGHYTRIFFGYRYLYAGTGNLNKSPVQQTDATITLSPISYHFLVLGLTLGDV